MKLSTEEVVQLPDFAFVHHCHKTYRVTNELYRCIDQFFSTYGIENRTERRKHLLSFLEYSSIKQPENKELINWGGKRLKSEMESYLEDSFVVLYMREKAGSPN